MAPPRRRRAADRHYFKHRLLAGACLAWIRHDGRATETTEPTENGTSGESVKNWMQSVFLRSARPYFLGGLGALCGWCLFSGYGIAGVAAADVRPSCCSSTSVIGPKRNWDRSQSSFRSVDARLSE